MSNEGIFNQRILDAMAYIGFVIGLANYGENLDQTKAQELLDNALDEIHGHLAVQDRKIDSILEILGGDINEEK
jgi:hypothetical protein